MSNNEFLDGIHNYCDRWCERCTFTPKCRVFFDGERDRRRHERRGEDPHSWDTAIADVGRNLAKAHRLLERFARREGINLDELAAEAESQPRRHRPDIEGDTLVKQADQFMVGCRDLLDQVRDVFGEECDGLNARSGFMDTSGQASALDRVRDAFEVICWDHTLIAVKLRRAMASVLTCDEEADAPDPDEVSAFDCAGSAAVVRRSLLRSQSALQTVYDWDESLRDRVIDLLVMAERLLRGLEAAVPACKTFTWPPPPGPWDKPDGSDAPEPPSRLN